MEAFPLKIQVLDMYMKFDCFSSTKHQATRIVYLSNPKHTEQVQITVKY